MRRFAAGLVLVALLASGCASTLSALAKTPGRVEDAFQDPVRRRHVFTQIGLEGSTATLAIVCGVFVPFPFSLGVCPVAAVVYNYLTYEFMLEPIAKDLVREGKPSITGPYWERGPYLDEGEKFERP